MLKSDHIIQIYEKLEDRLWLCVKDTSIYKIYLNYKGQH